MSWRRLAIVCAPLAVAFACSSFTSTSDGTGDVDAAVPEAGSDSSIADGVAPPSNDAGVDDFEATADCSPWTAVNAAGTRIDGGGNGTVFACRVCSKGAGGFLSKKIDVPAGTYTFEGYARSVDGGEWTLEIDYPYADGGPGYDQKTVPLTADWSRTTSNAVNVTVPANLRLVVFRRGAEDGQCFDVDELTLR